MVNLKIKAENEQKEKKIEILSKKINELEINLKDSKNYEKEYFNENKKNLEIIEKQEKEIKQLKKQITLDNKKIFDSHNKFNQKKDSEILLKRIEDLTNENNKLTKNINKLISQKPSQNLEITPNNYKIISNKYHDKLIWYLLSKKSSEKDDVNDYNNYLWIKETEIKKRRLKRF